MSTLPARSGRPLPALAWIRELSQRVDLVLVAAVVALCALSVLVVRASTLDDIDGNPDFFFRRQLVFVLVGLGLMVAATMIDYERLSRYTWPMLAALCGAVAVVLIVGSSARGSKRWIDLGFFQFQPSEIGKVAMAVVLAGVAVAHFDRLGTWRYTLTLVGITMIPTVVVFAQPDLGTAMVYFAILAAVLLVVGVPWSHLATLGAALVALILIVVVVLPSAGLPILKDYQVERLTAFTNATDVSSQAGFQLTQSKIAIGSGGAFGKGIDGATQTINDFLPEHHTDFIFAVVGEMFGFFGASALILVYGVILWRAILITARTPSELERLIASGLIAFFVFQLFVNIGMNMGISPITGIPLPLMSYGGSHTLTNLIAVGILLRIGRRPAPLLG